MADLTTQFPERFPTPEELQGWPFFDVWMLFCDYKAEEGRESPKTKAAEYELMRRHNEWARDLGIEHEIFPLNSNEDADK